MLERVWRKQNFSTLLVKMLMQPLWRKVAQTVKNLPVMQETQV